MPTEIENNQENNQNAANVALHNEKVAFNKANAQAASDHQAKEDAKREALQNTQAKIEVDKNATAMKKELKNRSQQDFVQKQQNKEYANTGKAVKQQSSFQADLVAPKELYEIFRLATGIESIQSMLAAIGQARQNNEDPSLGHMYGIAMGGFVGPLLSWYAQKGEPLSEDRKEEDLGAENAVLQSRNAAPAAPKPPR